MRVATKYGSWYELSGEVYFDYNDELWLLVQLDDGCQTWLSADRVEPEDQATAEYIAAEEAAYRLRQEARG